MSLARTNMENMLLAVMVMNDYVLMINLVSLLVIPRWNDVYNFINSMIEESRYCSKVMKKSFNKELVITKTSAKCWICDNNYVDSDVKGWDHCHIIRKDRGSAHRGYNINVTSSLKILILFHNLKNYDSHLIIEELGIVNLKINFIPNVLQRQMSLNLNNKIMSYNNELLKSSADSLGGIEKIVLGQFIVFFMLRFYPLPPLLLVVHTKIKEFLDLSIQKARYITYLIFPFK